VNTPVKRFLGFRIDVSLAHQTAERGLDVVSRATEPVVQVEVTESCVEVIAPEQVDHTAAEPDALRIASRPGQRLGGLGDFVDFFLTLFVFGGCLGGSLGWRLGRLAAALGESRT
jgi:hypothetical protein